jgi:hypothetical protein
MASDDMWLGIANIEQFCDPSMKNGAQFLGDAKNRQTKSMFVSAYNPANPARLCNLNGCQTGQLIIQII